MAPDVVHLPRHAQTDGNSGLLAYLQALPCEAWPDIVICENDVLALGAIDAVRHGLGLRVPQDIAVTGFDDIPNAASPAYDLTTYRQPITQMANALVKVLEGGGRKDEFCRDSSSPAVRADQFSANQIFFARHYKPPLCRTGSTASRDT